MGNAYIKGFIENRIYTGKLKKICFPGLNCYSCPGALGSCPIGSFQAVALDIRYKFSFYIAGFLLLIGVTLGRLICGWVCPFGFIQDLLYKIPGIKIKIHKVFNYFKYVVLILFVIILPVFLVDEFGTGAPYFCKLICPAGTLEAGLPLGLINPDLREGLGLLFKWKVAVLVLVIVLSILSKRPFCRVICPLGAIYSLFNRISFYQMSVDIGKCTKCGICTQNCPVDHAVYEKPNSKECIRCGGCKSKCPNKAVESGFKSYKTSKIPEKKAEDTNFQGYS